MVDVSQIYSLAAGSVFIILLTFKVVHMASTFLTSSDLKYWLFRRFIYPRLHLFFPLPYYEIVLQLIYWSGTIASNIIGVNTLKDASLRAAQLSLVNLIPLVASSSLSLTSYVLGLSARAVVRMHGSMSAITIAEGVFHIVTALITNKPLSFGNWRLLYGLIVCRASLSELFANIGRLPLL